MIASNARQSVDPAPQIARPQRSISGGSPLVSRATAMAVILGSLIMTHALPKSEGLSILLVMIIYSSFLIAVRRMGGRAGAVAGAAVGVAVAVELAWVSPASRLNQLAFGGVATCITALLGYIAGAVQVRSADASRTGPAANGVASADPSWPLANIARAYRDWLAGNDNDGWASFDLFIRSALRDHLGAVRVRCFHVNVDQGRIDPLTRAAQTDSKDVPAQQLLVPIDEWLKWVAASESPYVADPNRDSTVIDAFPGLPPDPEQRWAWILPIFDIEEVMGLVAIGRLEGGAGGFLGNRRFAAEMAQGVASLLNVFWMHMRERRELSVGRRIDAQSGVLNRVQLLARTEEIAAESVRDDEPLMALAIGIQGLRGLDDGGHWTLRDNLVERIGKLLRNRVRTDDLIGRFTDERFIVVLRRVGASLGVLVAQNLLQAVRAEMRAVEAAATEATTQARVNLVDEVIVRAGLASRSAASADGKRLLEHALALLDTARRDGCQLALDPAAANSAQDESQLTEENAVARLVAHIGSRPGEHA